MTDTRHLRPLAAVEVEERIQQVMEAMESATEDYDALAQSAAEAEADYKRDYARAVLAVIQHGEKMTVLEREARVTLHSADAMRHHLIAQAARNSTREHLLTLRSHMEALRTLASNIRAQS
jgi:hypothetical protein